MIIKVFQMMSGRIAPLRLGLNCENDIKRLVKLSKFTFGLLNINNNRIVPIMATNVILFSYVYHENWYNICVYGIPNALFTGLWGHLLWVVISHQFLVFY